MHSPHRTVWWGNVSIKRTNNKKNFFLDLKVRGLYIFRNTHHHILVLDALQAEVHPSIRILLGQGVHIFRTGDCAIEFSIRRFFARFQFCLCIGFFCFPELGLYAIHTNRFTFFIRQTQRCCGIGLGEQRICDGYSYLPIRDMINPFQQATIGIPMKNSKETTVCIGAMPTTQSPLSLKGVSSETL